MKKETRFILVMVIIFVVAILIAQSETNRGPVKPVVNPTISVEVFPSMTPIISVTPRISSTPSPKTTVSPTPVIIPKLSSIEQSLFDAINEYRQNEGLQKSNIGYSSCLLADTRLPEAPESFEKGYHVGFTQAIDRLGLKGEWNENLAEYYSKPDEVLKAWIASPTHQANLVKNITEMCVRTDGTYWVMESHG